MIQWSVEDQTKWIWKTQLWSSLVNSSCASLVAQRIKLLPAMRETWECVGKIPWRRKWQPTPVFLPGESHGQKSLAGYSPVQFSSVQSLSHVQLFATPRTAACQASLSITNSRSSLKLTSIESVMPSNPSPPAVNLSQHQGLFQ